MVEVVVARLGLDDPVRVATGFDRPNLSFAVVPCATKEAGHRGIAAALARPGALPAIVYAGTRQVYGKPMRLPVDETHLLNPTDVNGINKAAGEYYHLVYNNVFGLRACSLRLTNVYGPRQLLKHRVRRTSGATRLDRGQRVRATAKIRRNGNQVVPSGRAG